MTKTGTKDINAGVPGADNAVKKTARTSSPGRRKKKEPEEKVSAEASKQVNEMLAYSRRMLSLLAKEKEISQGIFYIADHSDNRQILKILSAYAYDSTDTGDRTFEFGEGFPGQVAKDRNLINISEVPEGYISIISGLGKANPASLIIFPVIHDDKVLAVIELASFQRFTEEDEDFLTRFSKTVAERMAGFLINK
jgi:putative methionine-R-sulfoxide reductase with GAF domain